MIGRRELRRDCHGVNSDEVRHINIEEKMNESDAVCGLHRFFRYHTPREF